MGDAWLPNFITLFQAMVQFNHGQILWPGQKIGLRGGPPGRGPSGQLYLEKPSLVDPKSIGEKQVGDMSG